MAENRSAGIGADSRTQFLLDRTIVADRGAKTSQHRIRADGESAHVLGDPESELHKGGEEGD